VIAEDSYLALSRAPRYSLTFALPLLLAYEALAVMLSKPASEGGGGIRNGADVLLRWLFISSAGQYGSVIFLAVVVLIGVWFVARDLKRNPRALRPAVFAGMFAESVIIAIGFGIVIGTLTAKVLGPVQPAMIGQVESASWTTRLMLSLGAGIYEELFFRVLLVSALAWLAKKYFGPGNWASGVVATVLGALVFSAFHYVPPFGDPLELQSFTFRALAGVAFSALYLTRGVGITAWSHALYDAFLLLI
jgi:hypothetical protein